MNVSMTGPNAANWQQPQIRNYAPPEQQNGPQQTDGYTPGGARPLADTVSRWTAVGTTALALAAIAGASEGVLGTVGIPVGLGSLAAVALSFVGKQNSLGALKAHGSLTDKAARVAAFSAIAAGVVSAAGGGDVATAALALPLLVAAPIATFGTIKDAMGGRKGPAQPQLPQNNWAPPQQGNVGFQPQQPNVSFQPQQPNVGFQPQQPQAPPAAPVQFGTNGAPAPRVQPGSQDQAPVQFGGPVGTQQQQAQGGPPAPPTYASGSKPYWQS